MEFSNLTPAVRDYIFSRPWPKGLQLDINEDELNQLWIIFFRDNWVTLAPQDHILITEIVKETITKLRADGIPIGFGAIQSRKENQ